MTPHAQDECKLRGIDNEPLAVKATCQGCEWETYKFNLFLCTCGALICVDCDCSKWCGKVGCTDNCCGQKCIKCKEIEE